MQSLKARQQDPPMPRRPATATAQLHSIPRRKPPALSRKISGAMSEDIYGSRIPAMRKRKNRIGRVGTILHCGNKHLEYGDHGKMIESYSEVRFDLNRRSSACAEP